MGLEFVETCFFYFGEEGSLVEETDAGDSFFGIDGLDYAEAGFTIGFSLGYIVPLKSENQSRE
jgi:hypothetical protein